MELGARRFEILTFDIRSLISGFFRLSTVVRPAARPPDSLNLRSLTPDL